MSEENDDKLFNNEVRIKGTVLSFEKKVSKAGNEWGALVIQHIRKFKDEETTEHYKISVFGKAMEGQGGKIKEHDFIEVVCRLESEPSKKDNNFWFIKLSLKDVKFLQIGDRGGNKSYDTESGTRETPAPKAVEDDAPLPF